MTIKARFLLAFSSVWFICYIFFPSWSLPVSNTSKLIVALIFISYLSINLILLSNWLKSETLIWGQTPFSLKYILKENFILVAAFAINFITHIYPITLPIPTSGDQSYHSYAPLGVLGKLNSTCEKYLHLPFSQGVAWLLLLLLIVILIIQNKLKIPWQNKLKWLFVALIILSCGYVILFTQSDILENLGRLERHLHRYPPLGKLTYLIWYSIVGVSEFKIRLISIIFFYASAIYLYRLVKLFMDSFIATASAILFIFSPIIFHYSHDIYLESGATFFVVSASFYFLKYYLHQNFIDLTLSSFLIGTGFLYKDTVLPIWVTMIVFGLIFRNIHSREFLTMGWFSIAPVAPWIIIQRLFPQQNYVFTPTHLLSFDVLLTQMKLAYSNITPPVFILFLVGAVAILISLKKRESIWIYFASWFVIYYLAITCFSIWYTSTRYMLPAYPVFAVVSAVGLAELNKLYRHLPKILLWLLILYMGITNCILSFKPLQWKFLNVQSYDSTIDAVYLPYDKLVLYVKQNVPQDSKVLAPMICEPSHFYLELNNIFDEYTWHRKVWIQKESQDMDNLYQFCRDQNFGYLVVADAPIPDWTKLISDEIVAKLKRQTDQRFTLIKSFEMAGNTLSLYQVK